LILFRVQNVAKRLDLRRINAMRFVHKIKPDSSALALAFDVPRNTTPGGCWTPAAAMAEPLLKRLPTKAGLTFAVEG
jgi:short subunit dehydrogenase-like uncharacterized protein